MKRLRDVCIDSVRSLKDNNIQISIDNSTTSSLYRIMSPQFYIRHYFLASTEPKTGAMVMRLRHVDDETSILMLISQAIILIMLIEWET